MSWCQEAGICDQYEIGIRLQPYNYRRIKPLQGGIRGYIPNTGNYKIAYKDGDNKIIEEKAVAAEVKKWKTALLLKAPDFNKRPHVVESGVLHPSRGPKVSARDVLALYHSQKAQYDVRPSALVVDVGDEVESGSTDNSPNHPADNEEDWGTMKVEQLKVHMRKESWLSKGTKTTSSID